MAGATRMYMGLIVLALTSGAVAQTGNQVPPANQPPVIPQPDPSKVVESRATVVSKPAGAPAKPGAINTADDLLNALQNADASFRSMVANLQKTKIFGELEGGGKQINTGRVVFLSEPGASGGSKGRRMFQVDFLTTIVDNVQRNEQRTFIFDGEWFVERKPDVKQIHKRQIVAPGQIVDPLAIGEGPFPIPIGQRRERILERFDAEIRPSDDFPDKDMVGGVPPQLKDTYQLLLTPREGMRESKQFQNIRIWYRKDNLLPVVARTSKRDDSIEIFVLTQIKINEAMPAGVFDINTPAGWDEQVDLFRQAEAAPAPASTPAQANPVQQTPPGKP